MTVPTESTESRAEAFFRGVVGLIALPFQLAFAALCVAVWLSPLLILLWLVAR